MEKISTIIDNKNIEIYIQIKKIKNIYFQVKDKNIILKLPRKLNLKQLNELIYKNRDWILKKHNEIIKMKDDEFIFLGNKYEIIFKENIDLEYIIVEDNKTIYISNKLIKKIIKDKKTNIESINSNVNTKFNTEKIKDYILQKEAIKRLETIFYEMVIYTGLKPTKLVIKSLKSCWGNCKSNKVITINSKVFIFDLDTIKYVIIHELCHLKEMNHSYKFWELVGKFEPEYKNIRNKMKKY